MKFSKTARLDEILLNFKTNLQIQKVIKYLFTIFSRLRNNNKKIML